AGGSRRRVEAWMAGAVAAYKVRGFVRDVGGEVVESLPGVIRVRLGGKGSVYWVPSGPLSWLGLGRSPIIDMELRLERSHPDQQSLLRIAVLMRSPDGEAPAHDPYFRAPCTPAFCALRAPLMAQAGTVPG